MGKIRLAMDLPEHNYCAIRGGGGLWGPTKHISLIIWCIMFRIGCWRKLLWPNRDTRRLFERTETY